MPASEVEATYLPENEWTAEDISRLCRWIGLNLYVDMGDSPFTGGEFTGILEAVDTIGLTIDGNHFLFDEVIHISPA